MTDDSVDIWIGCTSRHFLKDTVRSLEKLITRIGCSMNIIDDKELCCGSVLFTSGQHDDAVINMITVEKLLNDKGIQELVSICPGCTRTFREYYLPRSTNTLTSASHIAELLLENMEKLNFTNNEQITVTYHDPCHLGKHLGVIEEPRELIRAIPNVTLKEMRYNREDSFCCGSGGGVRAHNKDMANSASALRTQEAKETKAQYMITACPFCERSFGSAQEADDRSKGIKIMNLVDFVVMFVV